MSEESADDAVRGTYNCPVCGWNEPHAEHAGDLIRRLIREMMDRFPQRLSIGDKYRPAMAITDQAEADAYFERCVEHTMHCLDTTRDEAERIERTNLGYFAGYYDNETRARVERLFRCEHPIFGAIARHGPPTPDEALVAGVLAAKGLCALGMGAGPRHREGPMSVACRDRRSHWRRATDRHHAAQMGDLLNGVDDLLAEWQQQGREMPPAMTEAVDYCRGALADLVARVRGTA